MLYLFFFGIVVIVVMITHNPKTRYCRWRKDRSRNRGDQVYWVCDYCGADTMAGPDKPKGCLRPDA